MKKSVNFFEAVFSDTVFNIEGNTQVCCPFPHKAGNTEYYETNPSAGVELNKNVFHCFGCNRSYSEASFAAAYLNTSYENATRFLTAFHNSTTLDSWSFAEKNIDNERVQTLLNKLHISNKVAKELHLGYQGGGKDELAIPVILFDHIVDIVKYRPGQLPKYVRQQKSISGLPIPYELWKQSDKNRATIVCAGEKDMMIARSKGFNAISFTGGENNCPTMFLNEFKDRKVYIIYDNDEAGRMGAKKLAITLKKQARAVYVVDISETCTEKGEDLWDFFCKYNKRKEDLITLMKNTLEFTEEMAQQARREVYPIVPITDAIKPHNINKILRSNIQIIATTDSSYSTPTVVTAVKTKGSDSDEKQTMNEGDVRTWCLTETNYKELFYLIDSNLKEKVIDQYIKTDLLHIPIKEENVKITKDSRATVYKCVVTDTVETYESNTSVEFVAYSLNNRLENGKKYIATYKLVPHPQDGQRLVMVIKDVEESDDFLTSFKVTPEIITSLKKFQVNQGQSVQDKLNELIELAKGIVNADYNTTLLKVVDIWYHSVLQFSVGRIKDLRGYIDCLLVGESRIGKSSTVAAFQKMYGLGKIVSLAGSSATSAGLIGGSNKVAGGAYQTRAGVIPQNNKGAVIFEELIKCKADLIKELTDIRSSNKVRIHRVNGSIELPAYVRMLTLTNSKTHDGVPKPISSYSNGISILTDIIGTPEDIARYDMIAIFGFEANKEIDPFYEPPIPLPQIDYQNRIRWIWSRTQEQIYITSKVYQYAVQQANSLNTTYGTFINIFGVEAWQKIMRIAIAIAGYLCSTDENFEEIIVTEDHIDEACKLLIELYDNETFKLRQYVEDEKSCNALTNDDICVLEEIWRTSSLLLDYLSKNNQTTKTNLQMASGIGNDDFNRIIHKLARQNLIRIDKAFIFTTNKFTKGYNKIDRSIVIKREVVFNIE